MKRLSYLLFISIFFLSSSCQKDFEEINTNPESPENAPLGNLLVGSIISLNEIYLEDGLHNSSIVSQQCGTAFDHSSIGRYDMWSFNTHKLWQLSYRNLKNLNHIIEESKLRNQSNYLGIAKILKVLQHSFLVDLLGDVPYAEEGTIFESNLLSSEPYQSQQYIYKQLIKELKEASDLLTNSEDLIISESIYDGDIKKWEKLANALLLRTLMKVSNLPDFNVSNQLQELLQKPLLTSRNDQAAIHFEGSNYSNQLSRFRSASTVRSMYINSTLLTLMKKNNDPRIPFYCQQNELGEYVGKISGEIITLNSSKLGIKTVHSETFPITILNYSEQQFLLAEAAERGFISGDSKTYFQSAIRSDLLDNEVSEEDANQFINNEVNFDNSSNQLALIQEQLWISTFLEGIESFNTYRRTGIPNLSSPANNEVGSEVAQRFPYPALLWPTYKTTKYESAISNQNISDMDTDIFIKLIWAK